jgi:hypothetical protein
MATENVPEGELGQIGPHSMPDADSAFIAGAAGQMASGDGTVAGVSYEAMSHNPPDGGAHPAPYDSIKYSGRN